MTNPSTTYYCQVSDVADFLRTTINATSIPNDEQVAKIINRKEDEIDRRTGHAWRTVTVTEIYNLPLIYSYGWGEPIFLKHRSLKDLDSGQGDYIAVWDGGNYTNIAGSFTSNFAGTYNLETIYGRLFLRGYLFTILRDYRVKIQYRFGETVVPGDIADCAIKMTCIDLLTSSLRMDKLGVGTEYGLEYEKVIQTWRDDIERTIWDRSELQVIT